MVVAGGVNNVSQSDILDLELGIWRPGEPTVRKRERDC